MDKNNNISILNSDMFINNNNNNNTNKQILDDKKRKLTLNFDQQHINDESTPNAPLNTPQLTSNINNDSLTKRLKTAPNTLPIQTPTQALYNSLDTPNLLSDSLPTPVMQKIINEFVANTLGGSGGGNLTPSTNQQQTTFPHQNYLNTPKNNTDVTDCFQQALDNVKLKNAANNNNNHNLILLQQNFNNFSNNNHNNSNITLAPSYATLQPVSSNLYINNNNDKTGNGLIYISNHPQQQQQELNITKTDINNNNNNMFVKEEPQTVPVHNEITVVTSDGKIINKVRRSRKTSNNNNTNNKLASSSLSSSNSSSPVRTSTPHDGQLNMTPINLVEQEAIKIEKKRERNREAARKCRTRKLEKIAVLEEQVKQLNAKNTQITDESKSLKEEISTLKQRLQQHKQVHGCELTSI
jgi:hypothetical protein